MRLFVATESDLHDYLTLFLGSILYHRTRELCKEILLGLIRSPAVAGQDPRVRGVRLRGAVIKGEIDLSDCTGIRGAPLPPLLLEYCVIDGTTVNDIPIAIDASNARIYRLSLNRCRVAGRIDLTNAVLEGDLEISNIAPLDTRSCQIFGRQCQINGSVIAENAHLRTQPTKSDVDDMDYALNLVNADIHRSLILQPAFHAEGGVNIRGIRVNRDIWAEAAKLSENKFHSTESRLRPNQCSATV